MRKSSWAESGNVLSNWTVWWMTSPLWYGTRHQFEEGDFPKLHKANQAETLDERFDKAYKRELELSPSPNMVKVMLRALGWYYLKPWIAITFSCAFSVFIPIYLIKNLISFVSSTGVRDNLAGGLYIGGFFVSVLLSSTLRERSFYYTVISGLRARALVMMAVYNKATRLQSISSTVGEIVSMQSNDAYRIHELFRWAVFPYAISVTMIVVIILLIFEVGWLATVIGIGVEVVVYIPLQIAIGKYMSTKRFEIAAITDRRVRAMNEILSAMKLVKLYNWESSFAQRVNATRAEEMSEYRRMSLARSFNLLAATFAPLLAVFSIYVTLSFSGVALTPALVFTVSSLLDSAKFYLDFLPPSVKAASEGLVGLQRLGRFLLQDEPSDKRILQDSTEGYVKFENASFLWPSTRLVKFEDIETTLLDENSSVERKRTTLKQINIEIKKGELVAVVGPVGSGKSSLLAAVVGQLPLIDGELHVHGKIAYATQQAWMTNESLRSNVLFSQEYEEKRYMAALVAAQLLPDLEQLPAGDLTEIGERGINLSGGQKQRVSLARAVYSDRELYLLDDVLSAVDQHVGKKLFNDCICGALQNKTRIFVTNQLQYLPMCDRVVVLKKGEVAAIGTYDELVARNVDFGVPKTYAKKKADDEKENALGSPVKRSKSKPYKVEKGVFEGLKTQLEAYRVKVSQGKLVSSEDREIGSVDLQVYTDYMRSAGSIALFFCIFLLYAIGQVARLFPDLWLSWWVQRRFNEASTWYIWIYACLIGGAIVALILRNTLYTLWAIKAAGNLHDSVFTRVLRAPMKFFDSTPIGRILNRFTKDLDQIDDQLPMSLFNVLYSSASLLTTIGLVSSVLPWFLIAVAVALTLFFLFAVRYPLGSRPLGTSPSDVNFQRFYSNSSRQLKRIDSISRSPIYSHLSATLTGLITIRGYNLGETFIKENHRRIDRNLETSFYYEMSARWLVLRMEWTSALLVSIVALLMVVTPIDPATSALALTYSMTLAHMMATLVRASVDAENQFTSVERLTHYSTKLDMEASPDDPPGYEMPPNWPQQGKITFEHVEARYKPDSDPIICDLSFATKPAEKIGIVGRTGAGKSTLVLTLFRLIEISSGKITIDGVNIAEIGLSTLRSKLGIIPQDPVLFTGSIRSNLDPFYQRSDDEIWSALEKVHLGADIAASPAKLDTPVVENGENFSVGQRQLLCIARALLRNSKILVLDEATASIDLNTDNLIQKTIRESFVGCTVLTIAHRLHTIIDSDRILVLERGRLVELDSPYELLKNKKSFLSMLVKQTGKREASKLRNMAKEMYNLVLDKSLPASSPTRDGISSSDEVEAEPKETKEKKLHGKKRH